MSRSTYQPARNGAHRHTQTGTGCYASQKTSLNQPRGASSTRLKIVHVPPSTPKPRNNIPRTHVSSAPHCSTPSSSSLPLRQSPSSAESASPGHNSALLSPNPPIKIPPSTQSSPLRNTHTPPYQRTLPPHQPITHRKFPAFPFDHRPHIRLQGRKRRSNRAHNAREEEGLEVVLGRSKGGERDGMAVGWGAEVAEGGL